MKKITQHEKLCWKSPDFVEKCWSFIFLRLAKGIPRIRNLFCKFVQILMPQTFFYTLFIFLMNNALFVIHSIIHSIVQQKYSFKKFIHSKKHANYSFKEFIHSKKIQNYSFKKFIHSRNSKISHSKKCLFKLKMDYCPGLVSADLLMLLMHCCCWCADAAELGPGIARRPFYSNLLQLKFLNVYWLKSLNICKQICFLMMTHWCACGPFSSNLPKFLAKSTIFPLKVHFGHSIRNSAHTPSVPCVTNIRFDWCLIALKEQI